MRGKIPESFNFTSYGTDSCHWDLKS